MRWTRKGNAMPPCKFVKWFTKCLLYSLLKICTGLSLLFSCLFFYGDVLQMFPADCIRHHMHQTGEALEALRPKQVHTQQSLTPSFFFSTHTLRRAHQRVHSSSERWAWMYFLLQGKHFNRRHIYPDVFLRVGRVLRSSPLRRAALSPHVKWLRFLREHFAPSHRNKKPYYTMARVWKHKGERNEG